ncbi:MAG: hypothetical protein KGL21_03070, partial [Alphaproteobacteria bacterium]|nr:hypothetical protein [Alphaproteobacteria bacterium]
MARTAYLAASVVLATGGLGLAPAHADAPAQVALASPAAPSAVTPCGYSVCNVTFTAPQMLDLAQKLVLERNFTAAKPLLIALANQP